MNAGTDVLSMSDAPRSTSDCIVGGRRGSIDAVAGSLTWVYQRLWKQRFAEILRGSGA